MNEVFTEALNSLNAKLIKERTDVERWRRVHLMTAAATELLAPHWKADEDKVVEFEEKMDHAVDVAAKIIRDVEARVDQDDLESTTVFPEYVDELEDAILGSAAIEVGGKPNHVIECAFCGADESVPPGHKFGCIVDRVRTRQAAQVEHEASKKEQP